MAIINRLYRFSIVLFGFIFMAGGQIAAQDIDLNPYISQNDPALALKLLAQLNDWRIQEGHAPFELNPILTEMAIEQAAYVRHQDAIGDIQTYHIDQFGTSPGVRAVQRFGWQPFGNPDQIEIGENAGIGTINFTLDYWRNSEIHRRAALSDIYREAGVAAIPNGKTDTIFMIVFGARPNVLPMTFDPRDQLLFMPRENSRYSTIGNTTAEIRVFRDDGTPLTDTLAWRYAMRISNYTSNEIWVLYTSGTQQFIIEVDLLSNRAILPYSLSESSEQSTAYAATRTPTFTPEPTFTPTLTLTPVPTSLFTPTPSWTPTITHTPSSTWTPTITYTPSPTFTPTATATPTLMPTEIANPDVVLSYTNTALVLRNASARRLNLTDLRLVGAVGRATVAGWLSVASFPADAFPPNHCLVVTIGAARADTSGCSFVRSQIQITADRAFWAVGTFNVERGGTVVTTCQPMPTGRCLLLVP